MTPPKHSRLSLARRLRLQQLAVFEKVVEAGSILAASNELAMTQPAVSKSIQELEAQLGSALFVRGKRGVTLTEFGRLFEHHARTMLAELRHLAEALNAAQAGTAGHVIVGTLIPASATLLPDAIQRLHREAPEVVGRDDRADDLHELQDGCRVEEVHADDALGVAGRDGDLGHGE